MDIGGLFDSLLVRPMMYGLAEIAMLTGSAGMAIILFTILIRTLMLPLSIYQSKSQKAMMAVQPELKALQKKFGKDRQRMSQETMQLYKERGVNPFMGCLPLLLQLPVFFGLYWALLHLGGEGPDAVSSFRESFLWLPSLADPDAYPLFGDLALPGILPIFMAGSQYFMSKMMMMPSPDPQMQSMNKMMTVFMPLMLLVFGVMFPSGLVLYWAVSNVFSIVQQGMVVGWGPLLVPGSNLGDFPPAVASSNNSSEPSDGTTDEAARPARRTGKSHKGSKGKRRGKR